MARITLTETFLYRWRYALGYTFLGLLLAGMLVFAGLYVPGGLSQAEQASVIRSGALSLSDPSSFTIIHLPYHLLQAGILEVFGISEFTIKLPSLILGSIAAVALIFLLRRWFPPSISVLASLIAIATGQFIYIAQSGTPSIMYVFWAVILLFLGTQVTRSQRFPMLWKVLFAASAILSLYSPLSFYLWLAVAFTIMLHPHLRNAVRRMQKPQLIVASSIALLLAAPLITMLILNPQLGLSLLGIPTSMPNVIENMQTLLVQYFVFWAPDTTTVITPVFGIGTALLIGVGLYGLIRTLDTTRSYLLISWIVVLIPVLLIDPRYVTIVFIPAVMLLAAGLTSLITYWYRLFPLNPYARVAGLIPIIVLVAVLITSGIDRYFYGYHYSPNIAESFSRDLALLPKDTTRLVVADSELDFYQTVAHYRSDLQVSLDPPADSARFVISRAARPNVENTYDITRIITSPFSGAADRFYVYQNPTE